MIYLCDNLERFQIANIKKKYYHKLNLSADKFPISNDLLIMLLDKLIITYCSPYNNLMYAVAYKLKPLFSFYRPTTKPFALLELTMYSQELIMVYHMNSHPDPTLHKFINDLNKGKSYIDVYEESENKEQMLVFFKKYTYISDIELQQVLKKHFK